MNALNREKGRTKRNARKFEHSWLKRPTTIFVRMTLLLIIVLILQMSVYLLFFFNGGVVTETEKDSFLVLSERVDNRGIDLENNMIHRWTNFSRFEETIQAIIAEALEQEQVKADQITNNTQMCQNIITAAASGLIDMLRQNEVTGVFLILDCPDETNAYPGVYIRDYDPSTYASDNSDLLMERGIPAIAQQYQLALDGSWLSQFYFNTETEAEGRGQFYFRPLNAVLEADIEDRVSEYYCYWSLPFSLSEEDRNVITCSVPLIAEDGTVLGVYGIDITIERLQECLKYSELSDDNAGAYFLGVSTDGGQTYQKVCSSGPALQKVFGTNTELLSATAAEYEDIVLLGDDSANRDNPVYGAVHALSLYSAHTPFHGEQWVLIGALDSDHLLTFSNHVSRMIIISALASLVLGLIFVILAGRVLTNPITALVRELLTGSRHPGKPISLNRTGFKEIDTLSHAIELQSETAIKSASRTSKIIAMTHIPIGVFEYHSGASHVFCSQSLFFVLGWPESQNADAYLPRKEFDHRFRLLRKDLVDGQRLIYQVKGSDGAARWVQLFYREESHTCLGAFLDITQEVESMRRMEYERDYDTLTCIYNRRAFDQQMVSLFSPERRNEMKIAAMIMFDLDNLKYVNDTFGHEFGDQYIKAFAQHLSYFSKWSSVIGRRSGDEFNVFLYGFSNQQELRDIVEVFWKKGKLNVIRLPNGESLNVRASGGLAWYPQDGASYEKLLRLADFAMYDSKNTVKGDFREFNRDEYAKKSIFVQGQEALNHMIHDHMVRYAFQPIVIAADGSVFGYELLMRPDLEQFANLETLFRLAKSQSKLYELERLTWFEALAAFQSQVELGNIETHQWVFINSIASQALSEEDFCKIESMYGGLLSQMVMEIADIDELNLAVLKKKCKIIRCWNSRIALDDFECGSNSDSVMADLKPDFIKVNISVIRGIDQDLERQACLEELVREAKRHDILVLAEGVQTREEMETVIRLKVDLLQGYYLARPALEVPNIPKQVIEEIQTLKKKYIK